MKIKKFLSKFINYNSFLTILVFSLSFIPFLWFKNDQILLGYDNVFPLNAAAFLKDRFFSWSLTQGFGFDQSGQQGSLIIHFIDSVPELLGASHQLSQKIVFSLWFFLLILSSYIFVIRLEKYGFLKSKYLRFLFPVLYSLSFYVLQAWWVAERAKFSLVVAAPLILSIILPMTKEKLSYRKVLKYSALCSLILTIFNGGGWGGLPLYGGIIVILACFFIFYAFLFFVTNRGRDIAYLVLFNFILAAFYLFLNAYTLLPFITNVLTQFSSLVKAEGGAAGVISWTRYLSENTSFINLLRLQGIPDWYNNETHSYSLFYLSNPLLILVSFAFPLLLFASFLTNKKGNKNIIFFFLFILISSLFLTAGARKPMGFLFEFLMQHVPGFIIFRSPIYKFGYAYWFAASFLIGLTLSIFIEYIVSKTQKYKIGNLAKIFLPIFILAIIVAYHFPYLTGNIFNIEKTSVSSRVEVPPYVYDFSKWWGQRQSSDRILLLPRLNDNWYFDQYKWNYMSLFPLLGNFANENIVSNVAILSGNEKSLLDSFYSSINQEDYKKMDSFASMLGIRYFLIRKDFYHDLPSQETDNPAEVEVKLKSNPKIEKVSTFGEWIVYSYRDEKPMVSVSSNAVLSEGDNSFYFSEVRENSLSLDMVSFKKNPTMFSDIIVYPNCLSCLAEREDISVIFPKPKILADSALYEFVEIKNKLRDRGENSVEGRIIQNIGHTLRHAGQINELITRDKNEGYVSTVQAEYICMLKVILDDIPSIFALARNPYEIAIIMEQYLEAEDEYISEIITRVNKESLVINLQSIIYEINKVKDRLEQLYSKDDFNIRKIYILNIPTSGEYEQKIAMDSIGSLIDVDSSNMQLAIDDNPATSAASIDSESINFGKQYLEGGNHLLTLILPGQKNILPSPVIENVAGRVCYSSLVNNFSLDNTYRLNFVASNDFDPNFYFFVDNGDTFSPSLVAYLPVSGSQEKRHSYVISASKMPLKKGIKTLRVAFCATTLTEKNYYENVKQLSLVELTSPRVILHKAGENTFGSVPQISYRRLNQTKYSVEVKDAKNPFYFVFSQRFAPGWQLSFGDHTIGNRFENVWFINKTGDFAMHLEYKPQDYVSKGLAVSLFTLFSMGAYFLYIKIRNRI